MYQLLFINLTPKARLYHHYHKCRYKSCLIIHHHPSTYIITKKRFHLPTHLPLLRLLFFLINIQNRTGAGMSNSITRGVISGLVHKLNDKHPSLQGSKFDSQWRLLNFLKIMSLHEVFFQFLQGFACRCNLLIRCHIFRDHQTLVAP